MLHTKRIGVIGLVIEDRLDAAPRVNAVLAQYGSIIVGRLGVPYKERNVSVIALVVDGTSDHVGALSGKLGAIPGVRVKSALTSFAETSTPNPT